MSGLEILGGLAAAEQFAEVLFKTIKLVKSVVDQIHDAPGQVQQQIGRLESLESLATQIQNTPTLQTDDIIKILNRCERNVQSLHQLLSEISFRSQDSLGRKTWRAILSLQEEENILRVFDQLDQEYNSLNTHIILRTLEMAEKVQTGVHSIDTKLKSMARAYDATPESSKCLRDLFITNPAMDRADLITFKGEIVQGTCDWIVRRKEFIEWRDANGGLLWISGGPGQGKTMLSIHLTEYLATCFRSPNAEQRHFATYFFCDAKQQTRNNAVAILRGLLFQILEQDKSLISHILPSYEVQKERLFQQNSFETLWNFFIQMANDIGDSQMTCVLDGLDECEQSSLEPILTKLSRVTSTAPRLKVVIVSREYPQCLGASLGGFPRIRLDPDAKAEVSDGLNQYISTCVAELSESNHYPAELAHHVKQVLKEKSAGTYLWISFVVKDLRSLKLSEVEESLDRFPRGLDGLYKRMLGQIEPAHREMTLDILRWCAFLGNLEFGFLVGALKITATKLLDRKAVLQGKLAHCGHFLSITGHGVALVHQSAYDFLTARDSTSRALPWYSLAHIELEHSKLACACISRICAQNPKATLEEVCSPHERPIRGKDAFLYHASRSWTNHFRRSGPEGVRILDEHPNFFSCTTLDRKARAYWGLSEYPEGLAYAAARLGLTVLMQRAIKQEGSWLYLKDPWAHLDGWPLLHIAAEYGRAPIVDILIKHNKARLNIRAKGGNTPLHLAALRGHLDVVKILVRKGARIDSCNHNGQTPLFKTLDHADHQVAEYLLECGANVNVWDKDQFSPLTYAVLKKDNKMVKLLLDWGGDSRLERTGGRLSSKLQQCPGTLMVFLQHWARLSESQPLQFRDKVDFGNTTALHIACQAGDVAAIRLLLDPKWSLDVNRLDDEKDTPLHLAAKHDRLKAVEFLVTQPGIDPKCLNVKGHNLLQVALAHLHPDVVRYLVVNCNLPIPEPDGEDGWGALHFVLFNQPRRLAVRDYGLAPPDMLVPTLRFLVEELGVDPCLRTSLPKSRGDKWHRHSPSPWDCDDNPEDSCHESPLSFAIQRGYLNAVKYFLARCAIDPDASCRGCDGATPLHVAAHNLQDTIVGELIWNMANVHAVDDYRRTPLHVVANVRIMDDDSRIGRRDGIIGMLLRAGAQTSATDIDGHTPRDLFVSNKTSTIPRGEWARGREFDNIVKKRCSST